jgi:hypothetical protein
MFEFVQITAQYSNAVLVAILPYVSDFAKTLDLPIKMPVTTGHVLHFKCDPRKDHVGGMVVLTNNFQFTFLDGRVCVYRSPGSYYSLQNPELVSSFYGKTKVKEKDALKLARQTAKKLGYSKSEVQIDAAPHITAPEKVGSNEIPRYRFRWLDPRWKGARDEQDVIPAVFDIEVNAANREIEMICVPPMATGRPGPKVDIKPPVIRKQSGSQETKPSGRAVWVNETYARAFLNAVLPQISRFIEKTKLPIQTPVTTNDVDMSQYLCVDNGEGPSVQMYLKNGDRFNYHHGHVAAFYSHDAFLKFPKAGRAEDFVGSSNVSTNEAIAFTKELLEQLGCHENPMKMSFGSGEPIGTDNFIRYFIHYHRPEDHSYIASFEIDLGNKSVKSISLNEPSLWQKPPPVDVPMTMQTNRPSFTERKETK